MGQMIVRNIPDDVMERFKKAAKKAGKSAEALARDVIEEKAKPSRQEIIDRIGKLRATTKPVDLETAMRIMEEARNERDARPFDLEYQSDN